MTTTFQSMPSPGEGKRGITGHIFYLLRQANASGRRLLEQALESTGLTQPQFVTLSLIRAYGQLSGAQIAHISLLAPQTVTVITRNLVRAGMLIRRRDPEHAKIVHFALTRRGFRILAKASEDASAIECSLTQGLSPKHEEMIRRWLVGIAQRASLNQ